MTRAFAVGLLLFAVLVVPRRGYAQRSLGERVAASAGTGFGLQSNQFNSAGPTRYVQLDLAVLPTVWVTGEVQRWSSQTAEAPNDMLNFVFGGVQWYPLRSHGWFIDGAAGQVHLAVTEAIGHSSDTYHGDHLATSVGTGWDIPLGWKFSLTPSVSSSGTRGNFADHSCFTFFSPTGTSTTPCSDRTARRSFSLTHVGLALTIR